MPDPGGGRATQCRVILRTWRNDPTFDFAEPYRAFGALLREIANDPRKARLVDGVVVRIGRGDDPAAIDEWARGFAERRGLSWPRDPV